VRSQFCHVIDFAPTVLEVAGIPEPSMVNGVLQSPYEGTSMLYTFDAPDEPERHELQYFEMLGNRGIYFKGWSAVAKHRTPWKLTGEAQRTFDEEVWELYDGSSDYSQAHDLSREMPEKLRELQRLWLIEAAKYNVLPLDDRYNERINPEIAGRPDYITGNEQTLFPGKKRLTETSVLNIKNKRFQITAELVVPEGGARFVYNLVGVDVSVIDAEEPLPAGEHQVRAEFAYDGGGWPRAEPSPSTTTASRPARARSRPPHPSGSAQTRQRGLATSSAPPYYRAPPPPTPSSTARSTGFTSPQVSPITATWSTPKTSSTC
jgi:arylsulfatase